MSDTKCRRDVGVAAAQRCIELLRARQEVEFAECDAKRMMGENAWAVTELEQVIYDICAEFGIPYTPT